MEKTKQVDELMMIRSIQSKLKTLDENAIIRVLNYLNDWARNVCEETIECDPPVNYFSSEINA